MSVAELEALRVNDDVIPVSPQLQGEWAVLRRGLHESVVIFAANRVGQQIEGDLFALSFVSCCPNRVSNN